MKKRHLVFIFLICSWSAFGQSFRTNQLIFSPRLNFEYHLLTQLEVNGEQRTLSAPNNFWILNWFERPVQNWYAGAGLTLHKPLSPVGASLDLLFINRGLNVTQSVNGEMQTVNHRALGFSPRFMLKLRTGGIEKVVHGFLNIGGSYNRYINYKQTLDDEELTTELGNIRQNTWIGSIGVGIELTPGGVDELTYDDSGYDYSTASPNSFFNFYIRYHHHLNSFLNANYQAPDGSRPYQGLETALGYFTFGIVVRGRMEFRKVNY